MLGDLLTRYGSDKNQAHSYGPVYEELFGPIKWDVRNLLEVGIAWGCSLRAWRDFFPNATIWGLDHAADLVFEDRITSVRADSTNLSQVNDTLLDAKFDVIVDDGCHWHIEQKDTWRNLYDRVLPGGLYIIEDIQADDGIEVFSEFGAKIYNLRSVKNRGDDVMAVFFKPKENQ